MAASNLDKTLPAPIVGLIAKQCNKILETGSKPRNLDCREVGADTANRGGVLTNEAVVQHDVLGSVKSDGHDPSKVPVGVCVEYKTKEGLDALHLHNKRIVSNSKYMP